MSLSLFQSHWGQEVIFEVADAKFWIWFSFCKFLFRIIIVIGFKVVWPRQPQWPRKGVREFFQKLHFWNQCIPVKKMSYIPASRSNFFTKSLHRGGVLAIFIENEKKNTWCFQMINYRQKSTLFLLIFPSSHLIFIGTSNKYNFSNVVITFWNNPIYPLVFKFHAWVK